MKYWHKTWLYSQLTSKRQTTVKWQAPKNLTLRPKFWFLNLSLGRQRGKKAKKLFSRLSWKERIDYYNYVICKLNPIKCRLKCSRISYTTSKKKLLTKTNGNNRKLSHYNQKACRFSLNKCNCFIEQNQDGLNSAFFNKKSFFLIADCWKISTKKSVFYNFDFFRVML